ncbi:Isochorismatase-like protein [Fusarium redolens]|uniref:Isochorismatase-like protein n=1 Tax=Fusarium redolens TaxID=48865 RepID=A0A9P9FWY1_FUSRE|nr:Isochorismatase-like protein [Fusarium redolens]KAH7207819.1 Isochorismatase-like protein [Fusarium redolens]
MSTTTLDTSSPSAYGPSETALLLLDWYTLFVEKVAGPSAEPALKVAVELRNWAKAQNITVIHCLVDANGTPFPACKGVDRFQGLLEIMKNVEQPEPAELRTDDNDELTFYRVPGHISALKSPGLLAYLKEKGIKSLVLTGLSTSGCVLRTAVTATDAEFATTVISDACADGDGDLHRVILDKIIPSRGHVKIAAEFRKEFEASRNA